MNFLLNNLELELPEHHLLVGEKLLEEGRVVQLFESERNLWLAEVNGMEVEMQISPSKVRACSCECSVFQQEKMCGHVAAGLLALRRHLTERKIEKKASGTNKTNHYHRLTTSAVLDNVRPEDLKAFVGQYAKSNRSFALSLKARFAAGVPMPDSRDKFGQLLDATIQAGRGKDDRIVKSGHALLLKTVQELLAQAEDATALEHYGESWAIIASLLDKTVPVLRKIIGDNAALVAGIVSAFDRLATLVGLQLPPGLRQEIWDFCLDALHRPAYRLNELTAPLLHVLLAMCDGPAPATSLFEAIERELNKSNLPNGHYRALIQAKLTLLDRDGLAKLAEAFTLDCLANPPLLLNITEAAEAGGFLKKIKPLLEKGLRLIKQEAVKKRLEQALLRLARQEGDRRTIVLLARNRFLETKDFAYFDSCKSHHKGDWHPFVTQLIADLIRLPDYGQHTATLAELLARENRSAELLALLVELDSTDLFLRYDHILLKDHEGEVFTFYDNYLKSHLTDHLGPVPAKLVRRILDHLRACRAGHLADRLATSLLVAFADRTALAGELEEV